MYTVSQKPIAYISMLPSILLLEENGGRIAIIMTRVFVCDPYLVVFVSRSSPTYVISKQP